MLLLNTLYFNNVVNLNYAEFAKIVPGDDVIEAVGLNINNYKIFSLNCVLKLTLTLNLTLTLSLT